MSLVGCVLLGRPYRFLQEFTVYCQAKVRVSVPHAKVVHCGTAITNRQYG